MKEKVINSEILYVFKDISIDVSFVFFVLTLANAKIYIIVTNAESVKFIYSVKNFRPTYNFAIMFTSIYFSIYK